MRNLLLVLAVLIGFGSPASADWTARDANNNIITFKNANPCSSVVCVPIAEPVDASGAAFGTASNPFYLTFSTGAQLPAFSSPPSVKLQDGSGNAIGSTAGALNVNITGGGGGGGDVNINQINGATPSATNPLWVAPETGASWAVTGTFWPYTLGQQVDGSSVPVVLPADQIGSSGTGISQPTGGTGILGWLSGIYKALTGTLSVSWSGQSVTANLGTLNGVATAANQTGGGQKTQVVDPNGNVQDAAIAPVVSSSVESSHIIKASAGQVQGCYAINTTTVAGFLVLLNATSAPADGAVTPLAVVALPANGSASISPALLNPLSFSTGIVAVLTSASTPFTKTTTGGLQGFISCQAI